MKNKILEICEEKKAFDIKLIHVRKKTTLADYFIICSVYSTAQLNALKNDLLLTFKSELLHIDGNSSDHSWTAIDLGEIFVHIFLPETRIHFKLEEFWQKEQFNLDE